MDGTTGTMVVFTDGAGTMLDTADIMVMAGVDHGDGIDGTIGAMAVLDLDIQDSDIRDSDLDGTDLTMVTILDTHMVTVTETEITTETTVSLTEVMQSTIQEEEIIQDKRLIIVGFLQRQQEVVQM